MKAKAQLETLPEYDALLVKDMKLPAVERASGLERGADGFRVAGSRRRATWVVMPGVCRVSMSLATSRGEDEGCVPWEDEDVDSRFRITKARP